MGMTILPSKRDNHGPATIVCKDLQTNRRTLNSKFCPPPLPWKNEHSRPVPLAAFLIQAGQTVGGKPRDAPW